MRRFIPIGPEEMAQLQEMAAAAGHFSIEEALWSEDCGGYVVKIRHGPRPAEWRGFSDYLEAIGYINVLNAWRTLEEGSIR